MTVFILFRRQAVVSDGISTLYRRSLATGVVYVKQFPRSVSREALKEVAGRHGCVFGLWINDHRQQQLRPRSSQLPRVGIHLPSDQRNPKRQAAVRITTEKLPDTLEAIAQLPNPTKSEVQHCKDALLKVVNELKRLHIYAMPVTKYPDMFQVVARRALSLGMESRRFDRKLTDKPRHTQGMLDGYRSGFMAARREANVAELMQRCEASEDELGFMAEYFERLHEGYYANM
ncbi:hypothetical protein COEREDRAFT_8484 [Coemansia reversa NRRL 1564]|uniref:Uncharacterized protein n=1 Tax=Coemansia reversa (strain ATCC 12441 / NRRL 1564) TaxID=763665 RepID=A0A2G5BBG9_COERN|nr:hypothetical protein COEREDRAFT_8484 [Coemansia reversa NRRL 1564]|eukprot:PIA16359.1 hypothetical protein COEREDRAFT_8484 [Coemansia reversa NRRL 1564]